MKVRFWGTRGSIARAGPDTVRYGGNTSCVEVCSAAGTLVVLDCGTGAYGLGQSLMAGKSGAVDGSLLISHTHWDHIQGLPFFAPVRTSGNSWDIYAPHGLSQSLRETLSGQMQYTYFPITLEELEASVRYHDLVEGVFDIDDVRIRARYLNHPALTLGYRLEADGVSVVYACDHECLLRQPIPDENALRGRERSHVEFLEGADLVIHDTQFTAEEYPHRIGWGHSTPDYAAAVCHAAGVKQLALTHHDPSRTDAAVDQILARARSASLEKGRALRIFAAAEGQTMDLGVIPTARGAATESHFSALLRINWAVEAHSVFLGTLRPEAAKVIRAAAKAEDLPVASAKGGKDALPSVDGDHPSLVLLDMDAAPEQTRATCRALSERKGPDNKPRFSVVIIGDRSCGDPDTADLVIDEWLVWPFSEQYARTKIRAWVLRTKCQWMRARIPEDEQERLAELRRLRVLDTEPEERFDRITRIASEAFGVPIALISLVDGHRQWFKSCVGLDVTETAREAAFCAHAILEDEVLVVPDTLLDPRFADNPLVTGAPRVRFYAGCPVKSPGRHALGTLCLVDHQPRQIDARHIDLLKDLAHLVERELSVRPSSG